MLKTFEGFHAVSSRRCAYRKIAIVLRFVDCVENTKLLAHSYFLAVTSLSMGVMGQGEA